MRLRPFEEGDEEAVVVLWRACDLTRPWNDPHRDIARKLEVQRELFLVAVDRDALVGTVMAGYEGHRGWINYLAVSPDRRGAGIGRALIAEAERLLAERGCPKISLLVRTGNEAALGFSQAIGFAPDDAIPLGKRLTTD